MSALDDGTSEINAGNHGKPAHHGRLAGDGQAILVIQCGPLHLYQHVAGWQHGFVNGLQGGFVTSLPLGNEDSFKHNFSSVPKCHLASQRHVIEPMG